MGFLASQATEGFMSALHSLARENGGWFSQGRGFEEDAACCFFYPLLRRGKQWVHVLFGSKGN